MRHSFAPEEGSPRRGYLPKLHHERLRPLPSCGRCVIAKKSRGTWYVSFETSSPRRQFARLTETFANEREAKQFAKKKIGAAQNLTAGTINPHQPKRTVPSTQVPDWVDEPD